MPTATMGTIGIKRDPHTLQAIEYYQNIPTGIDNSKVIVVDPMLATAHTAVHAINQLKRLGAKNISFLSLISAPEGIKTLLKAHPDVQIYTTAVDDYLSEKGYIVPGAGDLGDRLFGTEH